MQTTDMKEEQVQKANYKLYADFFRLWEESAPLTFALFRGQQFLKVSIIHNISDLTERLVQVLTLI